MIIYCYLAWTITWSRMTRFSKTRLFWKPHIQISKSLFMLYNATVLFSGQKTRSNYSQLQTGIIIFRSILRIHTYLTKRFRKTFARGWLTLRFNKRLDEVFVSEFPVFVDLIFINLERKYPPYTNGYQSDHKKVPIHVKVLVRLNVCGLW